MGDMGTSKPGGRAGRIGGRSAHEALQELRDWRERHRAVHELGPVFAAVDKVLMPTRSQHLPDEGRAPQQRPAPAEKMSEVDKAVPPRRKPRRGELSLVVTSNFVARGPPAQWEIEAFAPLVRDFVRTYAEEMSTGKADKVSVCPDIGGGASGAK